MSDYADETMKLKQENNALKERIAELESTNKKKRKFRAITNGAFYRIFFDKKQPFNVAIPKARRQSKAKPLVKLKAMTCEDFCLNQVNCSSCPESIGPYHCRLFPDNNWEGRLNKLYRSEDGRFLLTKYK